MIPALRISVNNKEEMLQNISKVIDSEIKWTNSEFCEKVENIFAEMTQSMFGITLSTGSSAITALLYALEAANSMIFAPVLTAPATILSCLDTGSKIVLVDAEENTFAMSPEHLEKQIKKYYVGSGYSNGAIIMVHVGGVMSESVLKICEIAYKYNLKLIEDCAHAHGSTLNNRAAGSFGVAGTYSFFLTKTITCGEGGIVITNNKDIDEALRIIRNYGKSKGGLIVAKGSSWRLNEFSAAVLYSQINNYLVKGKKRRESIAQQYSTRIENDKFEIFTLPLNSTSGYYKYILKVNPVVQFDYKDFKKYMKDKEIILPARVFDRLTSEEPFIKTCKQILNLNEEFAVSSYLCEHHVCLPIYEDLSDVEVEMIIDAVNKYE